MTETTSTAAGALAHGGLVPPARVEADPPEGAHRATLLAVRGALAANWEKDEPRVVLFDHDGVTTVYVSTVSTLRPAVRADIRGAVRAALAEFARLAPFTRVVFLTRGRP